MIFYLYFANYFIVDKMQSDHFPASIIVVKKTLVKAEFLENRFSTLC